MILRKIILILCVFNIANGEVAVNEKDKIPILENKMFKLTDGEYLEKDDVKFQLNQSKKSLHDVVMFELSFELYSVLDSEQKYTLSDNIPNHKINDLKFVRERLFDIKLDIYFDDQLKDSFFITEDIAFRGGEKGAALEKVRGINDGNKKLETYFLFVYADDLTRVKLKPTIYLKDSNSSGQSIYISSRVVNLFIPRNSLFDNTISFDTGGMHIDLTKYSQHYDKLIMINIDDRLTHRSHRHSDD